MGVEFVTRPFSSSVPALAEPQPGFAKAAPARNSSTPSAHVETPPTPLHTRTASRAWRETQSSDRLPLFQRAWPAFLPHEHRALSSLGFNAARWEEMRNGHFTAVPGNYARLWDTLPTDQQHAATRLGFDVDSWNKLICVQVQILEHPKLAAVFNRACAGGRVACAQDAQAMVAAVSGIGGPNRKGQRLLTYLRDFYPKSFAPEARTILDRAIAHRRLFTFDSHGWKASVVPHRTPAEHVRSTKENTYIVNDASGMNPAAVVDIACPQTQEELANVVLRARHFGWRVNCVGARHSQGGQTTVGGSIQVDMAGFKHIEPLQDNKVWVEAGATWADVIGRLRDTHTGRTVQVMQASNIFSVGGSLSVNCHGRTAQDAPIASTVHALRLMQADGRVLTCSRTQNAEMFAHAIGGYGMYGIILAAQLSTVPDQPLRMRHKVVPMAQLPQALADAMGGDNVLAYGRLSPTFSGDGIVSAASVESEPDAQTADATHTPAAGLDFERMNLSFVEAVVLAISKWSEWFLGLRWWLEKRLRSSDATGTTSEMLNLSADGLKQLPWREGQKADVLEELFIPFDTAAKGEDAQARDARFQAFTQGLNAVQKAHGMASLNITMRHVKQDKDTKLNYAPKDMLAFVLYYNQDMVPTSYAKRAALQKDLIKLAREHEGNFYLPYLRHYSEADLRACYPNLDAALAYKQEVDPYGMFAPVILPRTHFG